MKTASAMDSRTSGLAVVYCSTDVPGIEGKRHLDDQERRCREHCARTGLEVAACFQDSMEPGGWSDRPGLFRLIQFVVQPSSRIGSVVVTGRDVLTNSRVADRLIEALLDHMKMAVETATGAEDQANHDTFLDPISACIAEYERMAIGAITKRGILETRRRGLLTSAPPIGYLSRRTPEGDREIVCDPEKAPVVSEAFRLAASGEVSRTEIIRRLERTGIRLSPRAARLTWKAIRRILSNRTYLGLVQVSDTEGWIKGCFAPLVDQQTFELAQVLMRHPHGVRLGAGEAYSEAGAMYAES